MPPPSPRLPQTIRRRLELPRFAAAELTPTRFADAEAKAKFAQTFVRFLAHDMPEHQFTQAFYQRLSMTFGHIAHFSRHGFLDHYFREPDDQRRFLRDTMEWIPAGNPAWTFCDVEIALQRRIQRSGLLEIHGITSRPLRSIVTGTSRPDRAAPSPGAAPTAAAPQGDLFARA